MGMEHDLETDAALHAFLLRLLQDRTEGRQFASAEYQALFPGHELEISRKYDELHGYKHLTESAATAPRLGFQIGRFLVQRELGRGGQGSVYLAEDPKLHRRVALKVLSAWAGLSSEALRRFRREAESASRLDHSGICPVYEADEADGLPFIVMRYVEGETLGRRIARQADQQRGDEEPVEAGAAAFPFATKSRGLSSVLLLHEQVARALHSAHEAGVVHRDVKPGNIMVTPAGDPVLLDFGLAKDAELEGNITQSGGIMGTPAYMAPEQIRGENRHVDRRSDVYGLAATLFECVTLRRPFVATTGDALFFAILNEEAPDACKLNALASRDLAVVLQTALEKNPVHRYQTALEFAEELRRVREKEPILARPAGTLLRLVRWSQRNPRIASAYAGLVLVLALGLALSSYLLGETKSSLREVERLSDLRALAFLGQEAEQMLWPALPEKIPAMDLWLAEARALHSRLDAHRSALAQLRARSLTLAPFESVELARLSAFVTNLEQLGAAIEELGERRAFAASIRQRSLEDPRTRWDETIGVIADRRKSPWYDGLILEPPIGFVPLGPDPDTGFQEFAHLQTGAVPIRDAATSKLLINEHTGLVFVLLPAGTFRMGSEPPGPGKPAGSPNVDPFVKNVGAMDLVGEMGPVHEISLEPFFLSKFEMTQGQWMRVFGENPSRYSPQIDMHSGVPTRVTLRNPIENVSWNRCRAILWRLDLIFPTEAQWEYAARGGTTTVHYSGDDIRSVNGHENLADEASAKYMLTWREFLEGWDDGYFVHAPVGSFLPNSFGLHDMEGNVREWCLDAWGSYRLPVVPATGERLAPNRFELVGSGHILRGGDFSTTNIPVAGRGGGGPPHSMTVHWGVRPAKFWKR